MRRSTHLFRPNYSVRAELALGALAWSMSVLALSAQTVAPASNVLTQTSQTDAATSGEQMPSFEVVSIRPDRSAEYSMSINVSPTTYVAKDVFVETLLNTAFQAKDFQLIGGPDWIRSDRFTVQGKFPSSLDPTKMPIKDGMKQISLMIRSMLVEQFNLRYHMSSREFPGYSLVVMKNGPKLSKAKPGEEYGVVVSHDKIVAHSFTASQIAEQLGSNLDQIVQDNTGLDGTYDFTLSYPSDYEGSSHDISQGGEEDSDER